MAARRSTGFKNKNIGGEKNNSTSSGRVIEAYKPDGSHSTPQHRHDVTRSLLVYAALSC